MRINFKLLQIGYLLDTIGYNWVFLWVFFMINLENFVITPEMLRLIAEIDEFKGTWKLYGQLKPERLSELRKVATIESIGSSTRIEGVKLSNIEIEKLLSNIKQYSFISRDEQEVAGYARVCDEIYASYSEIPFTENSIKQFHNWLLSYSDKDIRHRGEYKKFPNHVEAFDPSGKSLGVIFETTPPFETPFKMQELVLWTNEQLRIKQLHPLLVISIFVIIFLAIHPFQDGNGRLSRLLTTLLLLKSDYSYVIYSSLESIIEKNKESYYLSLRKTQQTFKNELPDFKPWIIFFLQALQKQKNHLLSKLEVERTLYIDLSPLSIQILSLITQHGKLQISDLEKITGSNRNTIKKHLSQLVSNNHIIKHGKGRATWYSII